MDTTRRDLLRSTLLAAALPRLASQDGVAPPAEREARRAVTAATCGPAGYVDHHGWIIPAADRDALQALEGAGGPALLPDAGGA